MTQLRYASDPDGGNTPHLFHPNINAESSYAAEALCEMVALNDISYSSAVNASDSPWESLDDLWSDAHCCYECRVVAAHYYGVDPDRVDEQEGLGELFG